MSEPKEGTFTLSASQCGCTVVATGDYRSVQKWAQSYDVQTEGPVPVDKDGNPTGKPAPSLIQPVKSAKPAKD